MSKDHHHSGPSQEDRAILALLAEELLSARVQLENLADTLCADQAVVTRHMSALQTLDSVGQRQAVIAQIISANDITSTARAVSLEAIARRLSGSAA
jgi:hypothetical protein